MTRKIQKGFRFKTRPQGKGKFFRLIFIGAVFIPGILSAQIITTVAGTGVGGFSGDGGPALAAALLDPVFVSFDPAGNYYFADELNNRIREVNKVTGIITTVAGGGIVVPGDGGLATLAKLKLPLQIAVSPAGDIYFADNGNNRVRKVSAATGIITTVAGTGVAGFSGDGGLATLATTKFPNGLVLDPAGNIYFIDSQNFRVREVNAVTGIITTIAGTGVAGFSGDGGPATSATFGNEAFLGMDSAGNLYIADEDNNRVREVKNATGIITTVAGNGTGAFSGDGGLATLGSLNNPVGLAFDSLGNLYIGDLGNERIREVNVATGIITTIAGTGTAGFSGDGGPPLAADLNTPCGVAFDSLGNLYIADYVNNRIREIIPVAATPTNTPTPTLIPIPTVTPTATQTPSVTPTVSATLTFTPPCELKVWPDPFNPRYAFGGTLKVGCLPPGARVSFYAVSGELVNQMSETSGMVQWNGTNGQGIPVSSGIYFYVIQNGNNVLTRGKFLINR